MVNNNLPNIVSELTDGNLDTNRSVDLGDSVLIIGTSERGPMNQPVRVTSPQAAADVFGSIEKGNLVRGYSEVFYGPRGVKDIRMCRISNGSNAILDLEEKSGTLEEKEQADGAYALRIEALEPGDTYNSVSIRQEIVDGQLSIVGYNPVSGLETVIPYDSTGAVANAITDVVGLASAINLDPNLGGIVVATANELTAEFEVKLDASGVAQFGTVSGGLLTVDLGDALQLADPNNDAITDDTDVVTPSGVPVTAGNRIVRLNEVYEKADTLVELDAGGYAQVTLPDPIQIGTTFLDLDLTAVGDGYGKHKIVNAYIGAGDDSTLIFKFNAYETIDSATLIVYRTSSAGTTVTVDSANYTLTIDGGSDDNEEAEITFNAGYAPQAGSIITVTYDSEKFTLTQSATLAAARASNSYSTYFAAGDKVTFGTAQPADIVIAYKAKKMYTIDVDVAVSDAKLGKIQFSNSSKQPDYATGVWVGIDVVYQPEWVNLSTAARALSGGTNGITMTNTQKYTVLTETYKAIEDYVSDLVFVMGTYLDDTKVVYDEETGLPVEVNAGFAAQLEAYLVSLQDGVNETYGIMAVKPADSPRLADVTTWYGKLATQSTADPIRARTTMDVLDAKHLHIVTFEAVIANPSITIPYATTSEAILAGIICKLPLNSAITNKRLGNQVTTCRFKLSSRQLDALTALRYITSTLDPDGTWRVTDGVTAAAIGSDYERSSTVRIVFGSMDVVRAAGRPFIGNLFNSAKKAALDTAITKGLMQLKGSGVLRNFQYTIQQTPAERALGTGRVPLTLWPEFELRKLEVTVKLSNA